MLKLKEWILSRRLRKAMETHQKKLQKLNKSISKIDGKIDKILISDYHKQKSNLDNSRKVYIQFMKDNNLWTSALEEKYNSVNLFHPLKMREFDIEYVKRIARQRLNKETKFNINKVLKKSNKRKYGDLEMEEFQFWHIVLQVTEEVCRVNNWMTREEWKKNNVPMNFLVKQLFIKSLSASEIKKYYAKQFFEQRRSMYGTKK